MCLVEKIKEYASTHPKDKIVFGRADFATLLPGAPTHELLDRAVSDRPVVIRHTSEHALWVNAKALTLAGIGDQPAANPAEEAYVIRDASGHPSGVLLEAAMELVERAVFTQLTKEDKLDMLREASLYLNRYGITCVVNATGSRAELELYAALRDRGQLTVRTKTSFGAVAGFPLAAPSTRCSIGMAWSSAAVANVTTRRVLLCRRGKNPTTCGALTIKGSSAWATRNTVIR